MDSTSPLNGLKAVFQTLGCKLNFAETSALRDRLAAEGVEAAAEGERADLCIVNTCSVTDTADHKCRQAIHRLTREHPGAFVLVMGCYAQLRPEQVAAIEGVDLVVGMEQKGDVVRLLKERVARRSGYFLKVQDGCDYYCTYCTIPYARGRSRNGSIASLVEQAEAAAAAGGREIVITGVNIGDFGRSTGERFVDLLRALDGVAGIERYRISSIEPNLLTDEVLDFCAASRAFMPHFHIPLQSGSDDVLRLMRRRYDTDFFRAKVERVRRVMPDAFIGVDVIVGTRGETRAFFDDACRFIESLDISQLHVFTYSERPGTKALSIPHVVSPEEKHERCRRLIDLSEQKRRSFYACYVGSVRPVLWEHSKAGRPVHGFTDNYIRVELADGHAADNTVTPARLGGFTPDGEALVAVTDDKN